MQMNRKTFLAIFALAAILRALFIWQAPLWYDENFSLLIARLSPDRMWQAILGDVHPPLWYLVIRPIAQLLPADRLADLGWMIRIPALLFSIASLYLFRRILRTLNLSAVVQTVAFALMAFLPFQLYYAQEARMYAMLECFVLLSVVALIEHRAWLLTFAIAGMMYSQNYGVFYAVTIGALALLMLVPAYAEAKELGIHQSLSETWAGKMIAHIIYGGLAWLPWAWIVYQQANKLTGSYWLSDISLGGTLKLITDLFGASYLPANLVTIGWGMVFIVLFIGLWYIVTQRPAHWLTVSLLAFMPLALAWIASALWQPIILFRPLIGSTPFIYLIVAWPLDYLTWEFREWKEWIYWTAPFYKTPVFKKALFISIFTVPLVMLMTARFYYANPRDKAHSADGRSSMTTLMARIRADWRPGDVLYHIEDGTMIWGLLYAPDLPQAMMPPCGRTLDALNPQTRNAIDPVMGDWQTLTAQGHRLWVLAPFLPTQPTCFDAALAPLTQSAPFALIEDDELIKSGVWLIGDK